MKKENILYIIITILLIIISSGVTYYIASNKNNDRNNNETINKANDTKKEEKITLSDTELNEYLSYLFINSGSTVYDKKITNVNTANKEYLLGTAIERIDKDEYEEITDTNEYDVTETYTYIREDKLKKLVQPILKKMYNLDITNFSFQKDPKENSYVAEYKGIGFINFKEGLIAVEAGVSYEKQSHIDSYEANDQELIIYEYAAGLDYGPILIDYYTRKEIDLTKQGYDYDDYDAAREYFKKHYTEFTKYKHTYKKNDTGYYWYQTEVVK